jgi:hypothetical protein
MQKISQLTAHQENLLDEYKRKWQLIALSTQPIDKQKATQSIESIYKQISKVEEFDIYFVDSPMSLGDLSFLTTIYPNENWCNQRKLSNLIRRVENQLLRRLIGGDVFRNIAIPLIEIVGNQMDMQLWHYIEERLHFWSPFANLIAINLKDKEQLSPIWKSAKPSQKEKLTNLWFYLGSGLVNTDSKCSLCCILDFCASELQCDLDEYLWEILKSFVNNCGWTFFFQDFCFACDRPFKIILDEQNRPHSENEAAIQFLDGFSIFVEHGESISQL